MRRAAGAKGGRYPMVRDFAGAEKDVFFALHRELKLKTYQEASDLMVHAGRERGPRHALSAVLAWRSAKDVPDFIKTKGVFAQLHKTHDALRALWFRLTYATWLRDCRVTPAAARDISAVEWDVAEENPFILLAHVSYRACLAFPGADQTSGALKRYGAAVDLLREHRFATRAEMEVQFTRCALDWSEDFLSIDPSCGRRAKHALFDEDAELNSGGGAESFMDVKRRCPDAQFGAWSAFRRLHNALYKDPATDLYWLRETHEARHGLHHLLSGLLEPAAAVAAAPKRARLDHGSAEGEAPNAAQDGVGHP